MNPSVGGKSRRSWELWNFVAKADLGFQFCLFVDRSSINTPSRNNHGEDPLPRSGSRWPDRSAPPSRNSIC